MFTKRDFQIGAAILGFGAAATAARSADVGTVTPDQTFSTLSFPTREAVPAQDSGATQTKAVDSAVTEQPRQGDFFDMSVETVIIPETKATPPVVATEADKFGMLIMAPSVFTAGIIGLGFVANWVGLKMGWIKEGEQSKPADNKLPRS